ncbi:MAG: C40 family peptidase [Solobacterium sp.]|nr:C40 family peptidase [Solobacterium sp.]
MSKNRKRIPLTFLIMIIGLITFNPTPVKAENETTSVYRLYNVSSGEHFYTVNENEKSGLEKSGWICEGVGWMAPVVSSQPVYRLYNPKAGDHHYTVNETEKEYLVKAGWKDEGIAFYSDEDKTYAVYRQFNSNQKKAGAHNYTVSEKERDVLVKAGWKNEGEGWYASAEGYSDPSAIEKINAKRAKLEASKASAKAEAAKSSGVTGTAIVSAARKWVGVGKYVSGGTNPKTGTDCSGFTQYIFRQFGISLNRTARSQASNGYKVSSPKPGDLAIWTGHVAIYAGNGVIIDAVNAKQDIRERAFGKSKGAGRFLGYYHIKGVSNGN